MSNRPEKYLPVSLKQQRRIIYAVWYWSNRLVPDGFLIIRHIYIYIYIYISPRFVLCAQYIPIGMHTHIKRYSVSNYKQFNSKFANKCKFFGSYILVNGISTDSRKPFLVCVYMCWNGVANYSYAHTSYCGSYFHSSKTTRDMNIKSLP